MNKQNRPAVSHLKSHIGYHLRVVSNTVSQNFARKLMTNEVTVAEWVILRQMYSDQNTTEQSISPSQIAELTGLTRGAISKLIDRLLVKKLVVRTESTVDRRYQDIELTTKAIKLIPKLARIADENDDHFFSVLSDTEKKVLMKIMIKLTNNHRLNTSPIN